MPIQKFHLPMSKLTVKSQTGSKPSDPTGNPLKWQRLKVKGHGGRENGETPFLWVPLPWAHIILQPSVPAYKMEGGKERGLDELLSV